MFHHFPWKHHQFFMVKRPSVTFQPGPKNRARPSVRRSRWPPHLLPWPRASHGGLENEPFIGDLRLSTTNHCFIHMNNLYVYIYIYTMYIIFIDLYNLYILVGGWATPLKNMKVNWDDYFQYIFQKHVPKFGDFSLPCLMTPEGNHEKCWSSHV